MPYLNTPIYTVMHIYSKESIVTIQSDGEVWQYLTIFYKFLGLQGIYNTLQY
jgi:hypothetical protein